MLLWMCTCTENQKKGTSAPQLYFGNITDTQSCTALCSKVSTFSFPTFAHRKQGCKAKSIDGVVCRNFDWLGVILQHRNIWAAMPLDQQQIFMNLAKHTRITQEECHIDHVQFPTQGLQKQPLGIKQEWAKPQSTLWEEDRRGFDVVASEGHCIRTCHAVHALLIQDP